MIAEQEIWVTEEGKVYHGDDPPSGSSLVASKGTEVNKALLDRFGLKASDVEKPAKREREEEPEAKAVAEPAETKAVAGPEARKGR